MNVSTHIIALCLAACTLTLNAAQLPAQIVQVFDQKVAFINSEAISKRDVEDRMNGVAEKLEFYKRMKKKDGQWDKEAEAEWTKLYVDSFREALRGLIRDRLKLQHFAFEKMSLDEKEFQKELSSVLQDLRNSQNTTFTPAEVSKRVRERMMLEEFAGKFNNAVEMPRKPDVEQYYFENKERYKRKAGVKVRIIRIDRTVVDKLTGAKKVRDNAYETAEDIRRNVTEFGALFSEEAKTKSDDDTKERGGLILGADKDPYIVAEEFNKVLANALKDLRLGGVSKIFEYGGGYAIAQLEDRREAGYMPLEGKLYDQVYGELRRIKGRKKEDEWFRATLAKSLVMQVIEGTAKPLPIEFFFPDDKKNADFISNEKTAPVDKEKQK